MRPAAAFVTIAALGVLLGSLWVGETRVERRARPSQVDPVPGPSAAEEAGYPEAPPTGTRPRPPHTRPLRRAPRPPTLRAQPSHLPPPSPAARPAPAAETAPSSSGETPTGSTLPLQAASGEAAASEAAPPPGGQPGGLAPVLRPPVLLTPSAIYPTEAQAVVLDRSALTPELQLAAPQGRVILKVLVRSDGTVGEVRVAASSGSPVLDRAAVEAAGAWRFQAATRDGEAVDAWALIPVRFSAP